MINKNIKMSECVGKYATLDHSIMNGAGQCIEKGSRVKIVGYGRTLSIQTDICPCCGQYCYIRGVKKDELTLIETQADSEHKEISGMLFGEPKECVSVYMK